MTVYPDRAQVRWWVKSWWNGSEVGELAVEIEEEIAQRFLRDEMSKDEMLNEYYPKQVEIYKATISQTRENLLKQISV